MTMLTLNVCCQLRPLPLTTEAACAFSLMTQSAQLLCSDNCFNRNSLQLHDFLKISCVLKQKCPGFDQHSLSRTLVDYSVYALFVAKSVVVASQMQIE